MLKETLLNNNKIILLDEFEKEKKDKFVQLQGILTSQIRTREKSNTPYYAFFRKDDNNKHSLNKCIKSKCKGCEIPVIFRLDSDSSNKCCKFQDNYHNSDCQNLNPKPLLNKDDRLILTGNWANPTKSSRPSFTCYSYHLLNDKDCANSYQILENHG